MEQAFNPLSDRAAGGETLLRWDIAPAITPISNACSSVACRQMPCPRAAGACLIAMSSSVILPIYREHLTLALPRGMRQHSGYWQGCADAGLVLPATDPAG